MTNVFIDIGKAVHGNLTTAIQSIIDNAITMTLTVFNGMALMRDVVIQRPLYYVYRYGPQRLGFWNGASDAFICEQITQGVEFTHWAKHPDECHTLIVHNFDAFVCFVAGSISC